MLVRWLRCCCAFGNRDARHLQYSNVIKKNSVPLKEVLTQRSASTSRASFDEAATRALDDARDACIVCIDACRNRKETLVLQCFLDSRSTHSSRDESERRMRSMVNGAVRGLRVLSFGKQKIFCVHRHVRSVARVEHHSCCESSSCDSQHAHRFADVMHDQFAIVGRREGW